MPPRVAASSPVGHGSDPRERAAHPRSNAIRQFSVRNAVAKLAAGPIRTFASYLYVQPSAHPKRWSACALPLAAWACTPISVRMDLLHSRRSSRAPSLKVCLHTPDWGLHSTLTQV